MVEFLIQANLVSSQVIVARRHLLLEPALRIHGIYIGLFGAETRAFLPSGLVHLVSISLTVVVLHVLVVAHLHLGDIATDVHVRLVRDASGLHLRVELVVDIRVRLGKNLAGGLDGLHLRVKYLADIALKLVPFRLDVFDREADDCPTDLHGHSVLRLETQLILQ